jgi:hypothetical protein
VHSVCELVSVPHLNTISGTLLPGSQSQVSLADHPFIQTQDQEADLTFTRRQHTRPLMAVQPVGTSCNRDDADCIAALVENYVSEGAGKNILICWEHDNSTGIVQVSGCSRLPDNS